MGYIPNPHYSRAKSLGHMVSELASTRAARLSMRTDRVDPAAARAERQRQRAAEGEREGTEGRPVRCAWGCSFSLALQVLRVLIT